MADAEEAPALLAALDPATPCRMRSRSIPGSDERRSSVSTERYVKLLPPLDETDPVERLNSYLRGRAVK